MSVTSSSASPTGPRLFPAAPGAFALAALVIVGWLVCGPLFGFSNTWQLVINTGTTIVTFLMVFLIQRSQNKESLAIQLKLNELVAATEGGQQPADRRRGPDRGRARRPARSLSQLADMAKHESDLRKPHSVEEAEARHRRKTHGKG